MENITQTFVCVDEEELERLRNNESRLLEMQSNFKYHFNSIDLDEEMRYMLKKIEKRQIEFQQYLYDLNGDIKFLEIENQRRIFDQTEKFNRLRSEYFTHFNKQKKEYITIFEEIDNKFTYLINSENQKRKKAFLEIQNKINSIFDDNFKKEERVNTFIIGLKKLFEELDKLPHEKFYPGELNNIKSEINQALNDFNNKLFEASIITARNTYKDLVELRDKIYQKEQEYITFHSLVTNTINYLKSTIESNKIQQFEIIKNNSKEYFEIDIDFWTNGELKRLEEKIDSFNLIIKDDSISLEEIKFKLSDLSAIHDKLSTLADYSKMNIISSQLRFNIAQKALKALKEQLFILIDSGYIESDFRKPYFIKVKNRSGIIITILISSLDNELNKNYIYLYSYDNKTKNKNIIEERTSEIINTLKRHGLEIGKATNINSSNISPELLI